MFTGKICNFNLLGYKLAKRILFGGFDYLCTPVYLHRKGVTISGNLTKA